jgi:hypothetical protein
MSLLSDFRQKYPQYGDLDDPTLADALYSRYYADMERDVFNERMGLAVAAPAAEETPEPVPEPPASSGYGESVTEQMFPARGDGGASAITGFVMPRGKEPDRPDSIIVPEAAESVSRDEWHNVANRYRHGEVAAREAMLADPGVEGAIAREIAARTAEEEKNLKPGDTLPDMPGSSWDIKKRVPRQATLGELGSDLADVAAQFPTAVGAGIKARMEGGDPAKIDYKDKFITEARQHLKKTENDPAGEDTLILGLHRKTLQQLPHNLAYSILAMGEGWVWGLGAGLAASPGGPVSAAIGTQAGRMAGSFAAAYAMDTNSFVRDMREGLDAGAVQVRGEPLTDEEFIRIARRYEGLIAEHGLYEAVPEAISSVVGLHVGKKIFQAAKAPLEGQMTRLVANAGAGLGVDLAGETVTQMGQHNVSVKAELSKDPMRDWTSPADWIKSGGEVAEGVLLQNAAMGAVPFLAGRARGAVSGAWSKPDAEAAVGAAAAAEQARQAVDSARVDFSQSQTISEAADAAPNMVPTVADYLNAPTGLPTPVSTPYTVDTGGAVPQMDSRLPSFDLQPDNVVPEGADFTQTAAPQMSQPGVVPSPTATASPAPAESYAQDTAMPVPDVRQPGFELRSPNAIPENADFAQGAATAPILDGTPPAPAFAEPGTTSPYAQDTTPVGVRADYRPEKVVPQPGAEIAPEVAPVTPGIAPAPAQPTPELSRLEAERLRALSEMERTYALMKKDMPAGAAAELERLRGLAEPTAPAVTPVAPVPGTVTGMKKAANDAIGSALASAPRDEAGQVVWRGETVEAVTRDELPDTAPATSNTLTKTQFDVLQAILKPSGTEIFVYKDKPGLSDGFADPTGQRRIFIASTTTAATAAIAGHEVAHLVQSSGGKYAQAMMAVLKEEATAFAWKDAAAQHPGAAADQQKLLQEIGADVAGNLLYGDPQFMKDVMARWREMEGSGIQSAVKNVIRAIGRRIGDIKKLFTTPGYQTQDARNVLDAYVNNLERVRGAMVDAFAEYYASGTEPALSEARRTSEREIPTRQPWGKKATDNAQTMLLATDLSSAMEDEGHVDKLVNTMGGYDSFKIDRRKSLAQRVEQIVRQGVDNLLYIWDRTPDAQRQIARQWYDAAHRIAADIEQATDVTRDQAAALLAILSPGTNWNANVAMARRMSQIWSREQDTVTTPEMVEKAKTVLVPDMKKWSSLTEEQQARWNAINQIKESLVGRRLSDLDDDTEIAIWIRLYDAAHGAYGFDAIEPDGKISGKVTKANGEQAKMNWGTVGDLAKAVSVVRDGGLETINLNLGQNHKVRNFYNNILTPESDQHVTIDTHAVAGALMMPLSQTSKELIHNFSGPASAVTGFTGTYPLYHEMYRRAGEARGVLPREMQSVVWEVTRLMFDPSLKRSGRAQQMNEVWREYKKGRLSYEAARDQVYALSNGVESAAGRPDRQDDQAAGAALDQGVVPAAVQPGGTADDAGTAGGSGRALPPESEKRPRLLFEVAPDPNNVELTGRWNGLNDEDKRQVSEKIAGKIIPKLLKSIGVKGEMTPHEGGYLGETNPGLSILLKDGTDPAAVVRAAKATGIVLEQDSVMVVSTQPFEGGEAGGLITITLPEGQTAKDVYSRIFPRNRDALAGHTTVGNVMAIVDMTGNTSAVAEDLAAFLGDDYPVEEDTGYYAFIGKDEYGQAEELQEAPAGQEAPGQSPLRAVTDRLRAEAGRLLEAELGQRGQGQEALESEKRLPWYSTLAQAVESAPSKLESLPGAGWSQWIKSNAARLGVKADELTFSGIEEWLSLRGNDKVTKAEIADYLADNGVAIRERVLGAPVRQWHGSTITRLEWGKWQIIPANPAREGVDKSATEAVRAPYRISHREDGDIPGEFATVAEARNHVYDLVEKETGRVVPERSVKDINAQDTQTRYDKYIIPGGRDYREMLIHLKGAGDESYQSQHWKEPGVLAHVRFDTRTVPGGAGLFVNELQSDWAQEGRRKGFGTVELPEKPVRGSALADNLTVGRPPVGDRTMREDFAKEYERVADLALTTLEADDRMAADLRRFNELTQALDDGFAGKQLDIKAMNEWLKIADSVVPDAFKDVDAMNPFERTFQAQGDQFGIMDKESGRWLSRGAASEEDAISHWLDLQHRNAMSDWERDVRNLQQEVVPSAPFVGKTEDWVGLAVKRLIRYAIDTGHQYVMLPSGQEVADVFDLTKHISKVVYRDASSRGIGQANLAAEEDAGELVAYDLKGKEVIKKTVAYEDLPDEIGKEVADKLLAQPPSHAQGAGLGMRQRQLEGIELKVGGEGMRKFYDEIVPKVTSKVIAKLDPSARLEKVGWQDSNRREYEVEEVSGSKGTGWVVVDDRGDEVSDVFARRSHAMEELESLYEGKGTAGDAIGFRITPKMASPMPLMSEKRDGFPGRETAAMAVQSKFQDSMNRFKQYANFARERGIPLSDDADVYAHATIETGKAAAALKTFHRQELSPLLKGIAKQKLSINDVDRALRGWIPVNPIVDKAVKDLLAFDNETFEIEKASGRVVNGYTEPMSVADVEFRRQRALLEQVKGEMGKSLVAMVYEIGDPRFATISAPEKVIAPKEAYAVRYSGLTLAAFATEADAKAFALEQSTRRKVAIGEIDVEKTTDTFETALVEEPAKPGRIPVYIDGHKVVVEIHDPIAWRQFTEAGIEGLHPLMRMAKDIHSGLTKAYTGWNIAFMLRNMGRDLGGGAFNLTGNYGAGFAIKALARYPSSLIQLARYEYTGKASKDVEAYQKAGGVTGALYASDWERVNEGVLNEHAQYMGAVETYQERMKELRQRGYTWVQADKVAGKDARAIALRSIPLVSKLLGYIESANAATEGALRLATYRTAIAAGQTELRAANAAKDVTVNFNRHGEWSNQMGALWLFFNANVQGTATAFRTLTKGDKKGQAIGYLGVLAMAGVIMATANRRKDPEKWDRLPDEIKYRRIVLMGKGEDTDTLLDLPYVVGIPYAMGVALSDLAHGRDPWKVSFALASAIGGQMTPVGNPVGDDERSIVAGMLPTVPGMVVRHAMNEGTMGGAIVPDGEYLKGLPDSAKMMRGTKGTAWEKMARNMNAATGGDAYHGGLVDISPETIRYYWNALTGGTGRTLADAANLPFLAAEGNVKTRDIPIVRDYRRDESMGDWRREFFAKKDEAKASADRFNAAVRAGDEKGIEKIALDEAELMALDQVARQFSEAMTFMRDEQDRARLNDKLSPEERRMKQAEFEKYEKDLIRDYNGVWKELMAEKQKRAKSVKMSP